jgi:signal transduction histidine kinase
MKSVSKISIEKFPFLNLNILQSRLSWSISLRWLALLGYFAATIVAESVFRIDLPYNTIWLILMILAVLNGIYYIIFKIYKEFTFRGEMIFLQIHIFIDLIFLTLLLHYSGGLENPIYLFYAFHVVLSSIIFPGLLPVIIATMAVLLFSMLVYLEYHQYISHYCIYHVNVHENEFIIYLTIAVFTITIYVTMYICMSFMYIFRNIKRQIDQQNKQLIDADKQKMQFFRFTSHELKSPIVAIKSAVDGVIKNYSDKMDKRATDLLGRASLRSEQMLEIIRELLELSRNRVQFTKEKKDRIDLHELITDIIEQQNQQLEEKKIICNLELTSDPVEIYGLKEDFKQIIMNLLSNAIRYTRADGLITIKTNRKAGEIEITLTDTGIGIDKHDLTKIYDEFFRSENAKQEVQIGTGLGLSIVKQIVDNYEGKIDVKSDLGKGTQFKVCLPAGNFNDAT